MMVVGVACAARTLPRRPAWSSVRTLAAIGARIRHTEAADPYLAGSVP